MRFVCPNCFRDYEAPDTVAGCAMSCTNCGKAFTIPQATLQPQPVVVTYAADPPLQPPPPVPQPRPHDEPGDRNADVWAARRRWRRKRESRAKFSLLVKWLVVAALGLGAYFSVQAARGRIAEAERQKELRGVRDKGAVADPR